MAAIIREPTIKSAHELARPERVELKVAAADARKWRFTLLRERPVGATLSEVAGERTCCARTG